MIPKAEYVTSLVTGFHRKVIILRIKARIFRLAIKEYGSVNTALKVFRELIQIKYQYAGKEKMAKLVKADGKYYWQIYLPGFPSKTFDHHFLGALNRIKPVKSFHNRLPFLFLGITEKCPLNCRHCYEWPSINKNQKLSVGDLKKIIAIFQDRGLSMIYLLGGEPMFSFEELIDLVRSIKPFTESWISTSGFGLDEEKAIVLKSAGLTGVAISVDHYIAEKHNEFRGNENAFDWALKATRNCTRAGLLTCWSICVSNDFISPENLMQYTQIAASHKVRFIQLFEPMAAGRYKDMDVSLQVKQQEVLENFYLKMNTDKRFRRLPIVNYPSYHQRRLGCLGGGNRYLYIDPNGSLHPCPFCRSERKIEMFSNDLNELLMELQKEECLLQSFKV